jgi:hypothetical protein
MDLLADAVRDIVDANRSRSPADKDDCQRSDAQLG